MKDIDPTVPLPRCFAVKDIDIKLHKIGLVPLLDQEANIERNWIHKPNVFVTAILIYMSQKLISLFVDNRHTLIVLADIGLQFGIKIHICFMIIMLGTMMLITMAVYRYNHHRHVPPTFLLLFKMLSGQISPASIGLTRLEDITYLLRLTRFVRYLYMHNKYIIPWVVMSFFIIININNFQSMEMTMVVLLNTAIHSTFMYSTLSIMGFQVLYLHILCNYFRLKIKNLNQTLLEIIDSKQRISRFREIQSEFDSIYREIDHYNRTYWSKFVINVWLLFGAFIDLLIYATILVPMGPMLTLFWIYYTSTMIVLYLFILSTICSVNHESKRSYVIFNRLYVSHAKNITVRPFRSCNKIKIKVKI